MAPILEKARELGFLGPGPLENHAIVAVALVAGWESAAGAASPERCLDLGSGAGVPGLLLALQWPTSRWVLLDSHGRRMEFARSAIRQLGMAERVTVHQARAEQAGRDPSLREGFDLVTARGFGEPAVVAECGGPFLAPAGVLVVSEPRDAGDRWPPAGLREVGLEVAGRGDGWMALRRRGDVPPPATLPRRVGIPAKRPLF